MNVYQIMEEILNVVEGRKEGESLEDFKKRLGDKEFNKQYDKYVDLTKKVIYSDKHDRRHRPHRGMSQRTHDLERERRNTFNKKELAGVIASGATSWPFHSKSKEERMDNDYNDLKAEMRANNKIKEAFELMEQICDFADNLFELDYEEKQNISPNKISKVKKGKDGEKVEVVSVADELFPYEGDAKQQFNQKILAKINDMIEGTGTLEDLIQFVRKGVASKKRAHEGYEEAEGILEAIRDHVEKKRLEVAHADPLEDREGYIKKVRDYEKLKNAYNDAHGRELEDAEVRASGGKDYTFRGFKKVSQARHHTKNTEGEDKTRERRANSRQIKKSIFRHYTKNVGKPEVKAYSDPTLKYYNMFSGDGGRLGIKYHNKSDKDKIKASIERYNKKLSKNESLEQAISVIESFIAEVRDPITRSAVGMTLRGKKANYDQHADDAIKYSERAKGAKGYRAQVNREKAEDAGRKATEANKDLRKTRSEYLDILRKEKGLTNPQAHAVLNKAIGEAFDLMEEILMETSYEKKMELLRKREENADQANVNAFKDLIRGYVVGATPEEKAKAEQDFAKSQAKNLEAQGKLNKARRLVQNSGKKKVNEALDLMEEIINEVSDRVYRIGKNKAADIGNAQEEAAKTAEGEDKEWTKDQVAKRSHQAAVLDDKYERQVAKRAEEKYKKSRVDKSSKK